MLPNHFGLFPPLPMQMHPQLPLHPSFFPFPLPYFFPFPHSPATDGYRVLALQEQNKQNQFLPKKTGRVAWGERDIAKQFVKKKTSNLEKRGEQALTGTKNYLKKNVELGEQKEGRNANSNLLRMFFRRLQFKLENDLQKLVKIWNKFNFNITVDEFAEWIREARIDFRNYIRVPSVKKLFHVGAKQREYGRILRVLLKLFLDGESLCCYLTSRKIKKQAMPYNLASIRFICAELFATEECK